VRQCRRARRHAAAGQTLTLQQGNFTSLKFLAAAVNGSQAGAAFVVAYTDGTKQTFTQGISDWSATTQYAGESVALAMSYRNIYTGTRVTGTRRLYGYAVPLNSAKTIKSITLPNDANVVLLAMALVL
jgi:hypothetical protein